MTGPQTFAPLPLPLLEGGGDIFLDRELGRVGAVVSANAGFLPQVATRAPLNPQDGWIRLSRSPWRPVAGTTVDAWVFYDATVPGWVLLP